MGGRVITAELLNKETEMYSFRSVLVRQTLLKNQPKKSLPITQRKKPHKTTVQHKDNKLRRQHCDMVAVCARQTVALVPQTSSC